MGGIFNFIKRNVGLISFLTIILLGFGFLNVHIEIPSGTQGPGVVEFRVVVGTSGEAAGVADYTCDGVNDDVQLQAAIDALPAGGGKIYVLPGTYVLTAAITRAIDNVTIEGVGRATYLTRDAVNPLFIAGGNNWIFTNLRTDAGSLTMGATTGWSWENVTINADYYAYRTPRASTTGADWEIPTGRTATYVVAASDAPAHVKAQADYVCDGTADNVEIQAAIDALPTSGGLIHLSTGIFNIAAPIELDDHGIWIDGESNGWSSSNGEEGTATTKINADAAIDAFWLGNNVVNVRGIKISNLTISGSAYNNAKAAFYSPYFAATKIDSPVIESLSINNYHYGVYLRADTAYISDCQILFVTHGIDFTMGGDLCSVNSVMCGDIFGVGFNAVSRVENCAVVNADDGPMGFTTATVGMLNCEIVDGCNIEAVQVGNTVAVGIKDCKIVTNNYLNKVTVGIQVTSTNYTRVISGNFVNNSVNLGIACGTGATSPTDVSITGNTVTNGGDQGILVYGGTRVNVVGNTCSGNTQNGIYVGGTSTDCNVTNNIILTNTAGQYGNDGSNVRVKISNNIGYIYSGEVRTASGTLTGGAANAILFSWHNPELQDILIKRVVLYLTAGDADAANIDVGIADDATYTNGGTEFFDDLTGETTGVYDSIATVTLGKQTVWVLCQDSASATDGWVVAKILTNDGTSIAGSYYIEFCGK